MVIGTQLVRRAEEDAIERDRPAGSGRERDGEVVLVRAQDVLRQRDEGWQRREAQIAHHVDVGDGQALAVHGKRDGIDEGWDQQCRAGRFRFSQSQREGAYRGAAPHPLGERGRIGQVDRPFGGEDLAVLAALVAGEIADGHVVFRFLQGEDRGQEAEAGNGDDQPGDAGDRPPAVLYRTPPGHSLIRPHWIAW